MVVLIFFSGAAVIQAVTFVAPLKVDINQELKMGILVVILVHITVACSHVLQYKSPAQTLPVKINQLSICEKHIKSIT